jgi:hypothetical protein
MKRTTYIRLSIFTLLLATSLVLISYSHKKATPDDKECTESEKGSQKKVQTEFILWESFSRNLFGSNG